MYGINFLLTVKKLMRASDLSCLHINSGFS